MADETFVDERSKEMFENDTHEKLLKELLKKVKTIIAKTKKDDC